MERKPCSEDEQQHEKCYQYRKEYFRYLALGRNVQDYIEQNESDNYSARRNGASEAVEAPGLYPRAFEKHNYADGNEDEAYQKQRIFSFHIPSKRSF